MKTTRTGTKEISLTLAVEVTEDTAAESVAEQLEKALSHLDGKVGRLSDVVVRTVPRIVSNAGAGYESRIWEKATCKIADNPRDRLIDPVVDLEKLSEQVIQLERQLGAVREGLARLQTGARG
ncbi:hypothetical protein NY99_16655 [Xanthomonas phaseoli pv. phaseoli]|uniref:Uncharacterized protein n=8 Tax=Xanthomonas TaxID=338 RepID=A0AAI7ZF59_XANAC|nr:MULTISPECIES: hypothetical protein [Xanthomonas]EKQ58399.1 hypothetical protein WS7_21285 [Xanthomonas citri pv. malvacearum str. GSPB2388]OOW60208.1 hypothetical protein Xths_19840 [Xanthomonas campestris pv. thespesiae]OOW74788.1 hypothetical protein Xlen_20725 [Xanthomonas campestris pv. leeana]UVG60661.1 hypothetical protein Xdur_010005 [Xanthomonas citri pv. durantae]AAM36788.1 hypothetical protein XAC1926 [Xanthomonas citri pv. citri str. 306]